MKPLEELFPFEYVGTGYFRRKGVPKGVTAELLHGMQAVEFLYEAMIRPAQRIPYEMSETETCLTPCPNGRDGVFVYSATCSKCKNFMRHDDTLRIIECSATSY